MGRYLGEGGRSVTVPMLRNSPEDLANKFESLIHMTSGASPLQVCSCYLNGLVLLYPSCTGIDCEVECLDSRG